MICKIRETVEKYGMLKKGSTVIAGISGGADSCALLHALVSLKEEYSLNIIAAHVNHGIRGAEAYRDEAFTVEFCKKLGVPCRVFHCDVPNEAAKAGMGLEEYGRKIRYGFFESIDKNALIATAHNLNDCCETLIFNITRGTTVHGLKSIPAVRGNIIRPLINCTREEIEKYCSENNIRFITDSTNSEDCYARNRIRLNVIPELKKINPSFENAVRRLIASSEEDNDYLDKSSDEILKKSVCDGGYNAVLLNSTHNSIKKRVIYKIIERELHKIPEKIHIENVCGILEGGKTQIMSGTCVAVKNGILKFGEEEVTQPWEMNVFPECEVFTPVKKIIFEIIQNSEQIRKQFVHKNMLDFDCTVGQLVLRSRVSGDEIRIAGRNCTKTVKKFLTEAKISDKNSVCILSDDSGVIWVEGLGCAERCRITDKTESVLRIIY